jgi:hypothetical protein
MNGAFRPIVRLGARLKGYSFSTDGAEGFITPTGDFGVGFRSGIGAVEVGAKCIFQFPGLFPETGN